MTVHEKNKVLVGVLISVSSAFILSVAALVVNANTVGNRCLMENKQIKKDMDLKADKWQLLLIDEKLNYIIEKIDEIEKGMEDAK